MSHSRRRWPFSPVVVLALALIGSVAVTHSVERATTERDRSRFENVQRGAQDRVLMRLQAYEAVLRSTAAIFAINEGTISRSQFARFVQSVNLQRIYPGIQGIGYLAHVPPGELSAVTARVRSEGVPDFKIWPEGERSDYYAITYLQPEDRRNRAALGFDMSTEPARREALERARDTGEPAMSGKVTLVQEIDEVKQAGFVVFVPVYSAVNPATVEERRGTLKGFIYAPFRADDLLEGIFGLESPRVTLTVYDGPVASPDAVLHAARAVAGHEPRFEATDAVTFGGRTWTIRYRTTPRFNEGSARSIFAYVALIGLLVSAVLFLIARGLQRAADEAEASRRNLQALFTQAPASVAVIRGPDFRYELSNPVNRAFAGGRELVGLTVKEAFPELEAQRLTALLEQVYRTGEPISATDFPLDLPTTDGTTRRVYLSGTYQPLRGPGGVVDGVMVFAHEVTEQVLARKKVEALADDLAGAVRVRDDFLSIAGHELKTPLSALLLQLQGLIAQTEKTEASKLPPPVRARLEKALGHTRRLRALVEELLDVSRLTTGRLTVQLDEVDLAEVCRDVAERFTEQARKERSPLELSVPATLKGRSDRVRLEQVISNLIANALKYGAEKPIHVTLAQAGDRAVLTVRDEGIGIPQADLERIFGRFERAVSERNYGGLGLGLWISRQIVEALNGEIRCESEPGKGSTFTVTLPLRAD